MRGLVHVHYGRLGLDPGAELLRVVARGDREGEEPERRAGIEHDVVPGGIGADGEPAAQLAGWHDRPGDLRAHVGGAIEALLVATITAAGTSVTRSAWRSRLMVSTSPGPEHSPLPCRTQRRTYSPATRLCQVPDVQPDPHPQRPGERRDRPGAARCRVVRARGPGGAGAGRRGAR